VPRAPNLSVVFYLRLIFEANKELGNASYNVNYAFMFFIT